MWLQLAESFYRSGELWCWNTKPQIFCQWDLKFLVRQVDSSTNCLLGSWWSCTSYTWGMSICKPNIIKKNIFRHFDAFIMFFEFVQMKDLCYWALQIQKSIMGIHCDLRPLSRYILKKKDFCGCDSTISKNSKFNVQSNCDIVQKNLSVSFQSITHHSKWWSESPCHYIVVSFNSY